MVISCICSVFEQSSQVVGNHLECQDFLNTTLMYLPSERLWQLMLLLHKALIINTLRTHRYKLPDTLYLTTHPLKAKSEALVWERSR